MNLAFLKDIPFFSWLTLITGTVCLLQGIFVVSKNIRSLTNRLYFYFCLSIVTWLIFMSLLSSRMFSDEISIFFSKCLYTGVLFMPTLALNFTVNFLGAHTKRRAEHDVALAYAFTFAFLILLWKSNDFITGIYKYSWGYYPAGGYIHVIHTFFVLFTALYAAYLLYRGMNIIRNQNGKTKHYYETKYLFLAFTFVIFGSSDFLHNWGINFFPIGCIFVVIFISATTYAIFKHELLGVTLVIKKSLVYSLLLSIITAVYFASVYTVGNIIGGLTETHSVPLVLMILMIITLLFKPLEQKIQSIVDKLFYKKTRATIEKENYLLNEELQKQDRMKAVATLAAGMAHEIKNPLTSIKTFAEYLPIKYDDPEFREKFQRIVVDEVDRMNNIIKQLLDFSKPEKLKISDASLLDIVEDTLSLLNNNLVKNKIRLTKALDKNIMIRVDKNLIKQALLNLFLNAIQAMPNGGLLVVESTKENGLVRIKIADSGMGIPAENIPLIFNPFFTTKEAGTGLGLSVVHGIIHEHAGRIDVESAVGKGTTVNVLLKNHN